MENWDKADRRIQETNRQLGGVTKTFGEVVEHLVLPGIEERFAEMGLNFNHFSPRRKLKDSSGRLVAEIDLLLENKDTIVALETKGKPSLKDIKSHGEKLVKLRELLGEEGNPGCDSRGRVRKRRKTRITQSRLLRDSAIRRHDVHGRSRGIRAKGLVS